MRKTREWEENGLMEYQPVLLAAEPKQLNWWFQMETTFCDGLRTTCNS